MIAAFLFYLGTTSRIATDFTGPIALTGQVVAIENDGKRPIKGAKVTVLNNGNSDITNDDGMFRIPTGSLPLGSKVRLHCDYPGHALFLPLNGECAVLQNGHLQELCLAKRGARVFISPDGIVRILEIMMDSSSKQTVEKGRTRGTVSRRELARICNAIGISQEVVDRAIATWAEDINEEASSTKLRAIKAFVKGDFASSAKLLDGEASRLEVHLAQDLRLAADAREQCGDMCLNADQFDQAIAHYQRAQMHFRTADLAADVEAVKLKVAFAINIKSASLVGPDVLTLRKEVIRRLMELKSSSDQAVRFEAFHALAIALANEARNTSGPKGVSLLQESLSLLNEASKLSPADPDDTLLIQNMLGIVNFRLFERTGGVPAETYFRNAEAAFAAALNAVTTNVVEDDATVKANRAILYRRRAFRLKKPEAKMMLKMAESLLREALTTFAGDEYEDDRAQAHCELAQVLTELGWLETSENARSLLNDAEKHVRQALIIDKRERWPIDWSIDQSLLGEILRIRGERSFNSTGDHDLANSVRAHREALTVRTKAVFPTQWAEAKLGLANAYRAQACRSASKQLCELAIATAEESLQVLARDHTPWEWSEAQAILGRMRLYLSELTTDKSEQIRLLNVALQDATRALDGRSGYDDSEGKAESRYLLASIHIGLANATSGKTAREHLAKALQGCSEVSAVWNCDVAPDRVALINRMRGDLDAGLANLEDGEKARLLWVSAEKNYRKTLGCWTKETQPLEWADIHHWLAICLARLAQLSPVEGALSNWRAAEAASRKALEVRRREARPFEWAATARNLLPSLVAIAQLTDEPNRARALTEAKKVCLELRSFCQIGTKEHIDATDIVGKVEFLQGDWFAAGKHSLATLEANPDDREALTRITISYEQHLFRFGELMVVLRKWLARHPDDESVKRDLAELKVLLERFEDGERDLLQITAPLKRAGVPPDALGPQYVILLTCQRVLGRQGLATTIEELRELVRGQPTAFQFDWLWGGMRHFVQTSKDARVIGHRDWLLHLIDAVDGKKRDEMIIALRAIKV